MVNSSNIDKPFVDDKNKRIALITGATTGIGLDTAIAMQRNGYLVVINHRNDDEIAQEISDKYKIETMKWDVSDYEACVFNVQKIIEKYGRIDVLVNNAGITKDKMLHKMEIDEWEEVIKVNLGSCFNMCKSVINSMREKNYGRIINISSVNALTGCAGQTNYSASKAGIIGFSKSLAKESANKGITVNCIAPGYIKTAMTSKLDPQIFENIKKQIPMGDFGSTEDISRTILFLADEMSKFITGATISVNGGLFMN